jgi:hypothetical protein
MGDMSLLGELSARVSPDGGEEGLFLAPEILRHLPRSEQQMAEWLGHAGNVLRRAVERREQIVIDDRTRPGRKSALDLEFLFGFSSWISSLVCGPSCSCGERGRYRAHSKNVRGLMRNRWLTILPSAELLRGRDA